MSIITKNPATGEKFNEYEEHSEYEVNRIIEKADKVFNAWKKTSFRERAELMNKAAKVLRDRRDDLAQLMAKEMGKPLSQGVSEAEKCAWVCEYYAENAEDHLKDQHFKTENSKSYVSFRPWGPCWQ